MIGKGEVEKDRRRNGRMKGRGNEEEEEMIKKGELENEKNEVDWR